MTTALSTVFPAATRFVKESRPIKVWQGRLLEEHFDNVCSYWRDTEEAPGGPTCDQQMLFFEGDRLVATSGYLGGYFHWQLRRMLLLLLVAPFPWWWPTCRGSIKDLLTKRVKNPGAVTTIVTIYADEYVSQFTMVNVFRVPPGLIASVLGLPESKATE